MNRTLILIAGVSGVSSLLLIDSAIKGSVLLLFATGIVYLLRRDSAATRHLVWLVAIVAMLAVPLFSFLLPQWRVLPEWASIADVQKEIRSADLQQASIDVPVFNVSSDFPQIDETSIESASEPTLSPLPVQDFPPVPEADGVSSVPVAVAETASEPQPTMWNWKTTTVAMWLVGFSLLILRLIAARVLLWRTECKSSAPKHHENQAQGINASFTAACATLNIRQSVKLLFHRDKTIPIVWGIFRPRLMLPDSAHDWSDEQLRSVLLHELAHIKRRDILGQLLAQFACALHWFNPLMWFASWRLHVERERACDDLVLASGIRASAYAEHLLNVTTRLTSAPWTQSCGLAMARSSSLHTRLSAVLSEKQNRRCVSTVLLVASLVLSLGIAIPLAMLRAAEEPNATSPEANEPVKKVPVKKVPLKPWAYQGMDSALLRRWQKLQGTGEPIPESRVATLRSAIGRFLDEIDNSPFTVSPTKQAALKALQLRGQERKQHTASEAQELIYDVFAIHGEPIQMAFNEAPWPGTPRKVEDLEQLAFGPAAANGLRVALRCTKENFIFGDAARLDLLLWNSGTETLIVGIGRDTPGLYPKLNLRAEGRDGRMLATTTGPESQMLADIKFTKMWQLRPGESADVYGYRVRVGSGTPHEHEGWPDWYTLIEMPDVESGEKINLTATLPYPSAPGEPTGEAPIQTGSITIQATAPEDVLVWSPAGSGTWPMPGGVTLNLKRELFHGADVATSVVLTWPKDKTGTTFAHTTWIASDAFGNREPWDVAWERNSTVFWVMTGQLGARNENGLPIASQVRRIDFSDKMKITSTTWYHQPKSMPESIRAKFLKSFNPLRTEPRRASETEGSVRVEEAHDTRPIEELLNGVWQNEDGDIDVSVTIPKSNTGEINWTIGFQQESGVSVVSAKLSRIKSPADNSIGLYVDSAPGGFVQDENILGKLRRGPNNTLLLDITPRPKYPDYVASTGIVLVRAPVSKVNPENSEQEIDTQDSNDDQSPKPPAEAPEEATTLPSNFESLLDWGNPIDGLRGAVMIQTAVQKPELANRPKVFLVLQNVSDQAIRFCDTRMKKNKDVRVNEDKRTLYLRDADEGILSGFSSSGGTNIDVELQPREVVMIDQFYGEQPNEKGLTGSAAIVDVIIHNPSLSYSASLNLVTAPPGAWSGKLTTPSTRGAFSAKGPLPKNEVAQQFFKYCIDHARLNGAIPGGMINLLNEKVRYFIKLNTGDQFGDAYAKKMQPILARFEKTGDWSQGDAATLFDEIAAVTTIPLNTTMDAIRERTLQRGQVLPVSLQNANWGEALPGGLRMAWMLEPVADQYHLGSSLKSRVVIHNSGKEPVAFVTRSFHQLGHVAKNESGATIQQESTYWTTIGRPEPYRLHPGEFCEVYAPGIGVGPRNTDEFDWANIRPGTWILASEGTNVVFQPGDVWLTGDHNQKVDPGWWLKFITERLNREAPLPSNQAERKLILFRTVQDLFGTAPRTEEAESFYADKSSEALENLALMLSKRSWLTSVTGAIKSGPTKFQVLPKDPNAATRPRVAFNPGRYNVGEEMRLVVTRRRSGSRMLNEANLTWYPKGKDSVPTPISLPYGYQTWAAGMMPGTRVLWIVTKDSLRSYDCSNPDSIQIQQFDGEQQSSAPIPNALRKQLTGILATSEQPTPAPQPAADTKND